MMPTITDQYHLADQWDKACVEAFQERREVKFFLASDMNYGSDEIAIGGMEEDRLDYDDWDFAAEGL